MEVLVQALGDLFEPLRLLMLFIGVLLGLVIGVIPGIGGLFGLTILVPITYTLDPVSAFALLLGMSAVTTTSDTIPAVLLGVPGTVGSAATAIDGHELAKQGHAARAIGAAYSASLLGGLFGALALALALPLMRPLVLALNYGDLLAVTIFGMTLVSLLSGPSQFRGLLAALLGALVSFIGLDPYESAERWTFGQIHFWDGVPVAVLFLGLFGLSELASLARRGQIAARHAEAPVRGLLRGMGETLGHWWLVLRCSGLGALLGAIPGVGVTVIEWIAYGLAARRPGSGPPVGKGNIRAVIAPESANNAKEGGALVPTLAFGVPGSATMAILLGAFALHGLVPGPEMLGREAPLLVTMVLAIALANVFGTLICLGFTPLLARLALVPATTIVPLALVFVALGAFHAGKDPRDLLVLGVFGAIGITFRHLGWSRPAFALGFVLGPNLERFFVLTYQISGWNWLTQPVVIVILAFAAAGVLRQLRGWRRGRRAIEPDPAPVASMILGAALLALSSAAFASTWTMPFATGLFPRVVSACAVLMAVAVIIESWLRRRRQGRGRDSATLRALAGDLGILLWTAGLSLLLLSLGHLWGPVAFVLAAAAIHGRPRPPGAFVTAVAVAAVIHAVFDLLIGQSWPEPWLLPW